jgi:hypothetical protein
MLRADNDERRDRLGLGAESAPVFINEGSDADERLTYFGPCCPSAISPPLAPLPAFRPLS